jgi:ATP-dependent Clp protease adapter protein ClpS
MSSGYYRDVLGTVVGALFTGLCAMLWARQHRRRPAALPAPSDFDDDAQIALHVAEREAATRGIPVAPAHVLFGLLQVEPFTRAVAAAGGDPEAIERSVLDALGGAAPEGQRVLERLARIGAGARQTGRPATCADLWRWVAHSSGAALLAGLDVHAVLFRLVHGGAEPPDALPDPEVHLGLRTDDYTPMAWVTAVERAVLGLAEPEATALMRQTHEQGRAILGRFPVAAARAKVHALRARARAAAFPLWIGVEPW